MRTLSSYLLEEITAPFIVGLLVILVMLLGDQLYELLNLLLAKDVAPLTVVRLLLFILPDMMVVAFPLATILAVSLALDRLVREREWDAMRLAGCSLGRLLLPIHCFGLVAGGLAWFVSEHLAPAAKREYVAIHTRLALADPTVVIQPQSWFQAPGRDRWLFVDRIAETTGEMFEVVVFSDLQGDYPSALFARRAQRVGDKLVLREVVRHLWRPDGSLQRESETAVAEVQFASLLPESIGTPSTAGELTSGQLREMIRQSADQGVARTDQVIDLHRRYAAPVACYLLALLCVPLNILLSRRGGFMGLLITSVLVVVYFLTHEIGVTLARDGFLQRVPLLGVWLQNLLFGGLALLLLRRCR
ncbi:MAG: LptF/LptG family permease [Fimbriimonadaceae bacterium]|nr:LptF/LptG family permease [Fimbriimonadaceae bacterium]